MLKKNYITLYKQTSVGGITENTIYFLDYSSFHFSYCHL